MVVSAASSISILEALSACLQAQQRHLELAMSLSLGIGSKTLMILSPPARSPLREQDTVGGLESPTKQMHFGSKEDAFFDSQGWLDSDSEDDFVSVNGDLTPYRLSSPNYQIAADRTPQMNKELSSHTAPETTSDPSPDAKRKLATLLQEEHVEVVAKQNASGGSEITGKPESYEVNEPLVPQFNHQTPFITRNENSIEDLKQQKDKKMKTNRCCLPSLVCSLRFKERRKQKMSIVH